MSCNDFKNLSEPTKNSEEIDNFLGKYYLKITHYE